MNLKIRARGITSPMDLRAHVTRTLNHALGRFGARIRDIDVQLTDVNGPKGGDDVECQIRARLAPRGELVVQSRLADPVTAVAEATHRAERRLRRRLERIRDKRRQRRRARRSNETA